MYILFSRLDSAAVQENAGARIHPLPPPPHFPFQRSSLVGEDQRPDQGDGWHRAYSPYVSAGTKWEKLLNNEKISKGLFVVSVQLVAVLSDSSLKV